MASNNPEMDKIKAELASAHKVYMYRFELKSLPVDWDYLGDAVYEWQN